MRRYLDGGDTDDDIFREQPSLYVFCRWFLWQPENNGVKGKERIGHCKINEEHNNNNGKEFKKTVGIDVKENYIRSSNMTLKSL